MAQRRGVLGEGMFPSPPARGSGEALSSPGGVHGKDLAIQKVF